MPRLEVQADNLIEAQALWRQHPLKILILSERYLPSIGGVQLVTRLVSEGLARAGQRVTVATCEPGEEANRCCVRVLRQPGAVELLREYRKADAVILQGLTMRLGWPLLVLRQRGLTVHHIQPSAGIGTPVGGLRARLAARVKHSAVSHELANQLPWPPDVVLPNPYDSEVFRRDQTIGRTRDVIFVGRLIPEKGVPVLIEALSILQRGGQAVTATIVGDGPERTTLGQLVQTANLEPSLRFAGQVRGPGLARLLNQHRLMVVPSIYEAFGLVALEGLACGCVVIGSKAGGIPEAIGLCGTTFPPGDAPALGAKIQELLGSPEARERFQSGAEAHLARHRPDAVAQSYLRFLRRMATEEFGRAPRSICQAGH